MKIKIILILMLAMFISPQVFSASNPEENLQDKILLLKDFAYQLRHECVNSDCKDREDLYAFNNFALASTFLKFAANKITNTLEVQKSNKMRSCKDNAYIEFTSFNTEMMMEFEHAFDFNPNIIISSAGIKKYNDVLIPILDGFLSGTTQVKNNFLELFQICDLDAEGFGKKHFDDINKIIENL